jgi:hypothetical protein
MISQTLEISYEAIIEKFVEAEYNLPYSKQRLHFVDWIDQAFSCVDIPEDAIWSVMLVIGDVFDEINKIAKTAGGDYTNQIVFTVMVHAPGGNSYFWNIEEWINMSTFHSLYNETHCVTKPQKEV